MIGIICAMEEEIKGVLDIMDNKTDKIISKISFTKGKICRHNIVAALSGVGKVNAAICTQTMIIEYKPELIINVGVAGGIGKNINPFDLVIAKNVIQYDFDISALGKIPRGEISGLGIVRFKCCEYFNKLIIKASREIPNLNIHTGTILTGDQFIADQSTLSELRNEFGGIACEMEGGSIGQVCYINEVDFCIIRSISDNADSSAHTDYVSFLEKASYIPSQILKTMLSSLSEFLLYKYLL